MKKVLIIIFFAVLFYPFFVLAEQIDINSATLSQLDEIVHVGTKTAQKIIDARPYSSVRDLSRVKGIGDGKYLQDIINQGWACVNCQTEIAQAQQPTPITNQTPTTDEQKMDVTATTPPTPAITYPTGVILNEILPSPEGADDQNEWIELYNTNNFEVDLSGWKIKDKEGSITNYSLPENTKISAYGYLVFKRPDTKITLNNTIDGLFFYWPNGETIDSMTYEKAPINQSYNKIGTNWQWSASLTPGAKNIIFQNKAGQGTEDLSKTEKSGNSKEVDKSLAALNQSINQEERENTNPWFLFLAALAITIFSAIIVLFIKFKFKKHVRT